MRMARRMARSATRDRASWRLEWRREGDAIVRDFEFEDFAAAMAFVNRVAELAEEANHHPDILVHGWNKVRLTLIDPLRGRAHRQADLDAGRGAIDAPAAGAPASASLLPFAVADERRRPSSK